MDQKAELTVAEIRWFWRDQLPEQLEAWFCSERQHGCPVGGGPRGAELPSGADLDGRNPLTALLDADDRELDFEESRPDEIVNAPPFVGPVRRRLKRPGGPGERTSGGAEIVERQRWLRIFDTSDGWAREIAPDPSGRRADGKRWARFGCICKLAQLETTRGAVWWTLALEASGDSENAVRNLSLVAAALAARRPPLWARGLLATYPQWLRQQNGRSASLLVPALA